MIQAQAGLGMALFTSFEAMGPFKAGVLAGRFAGASRIGSGPGLSGDRALFEPGTG
ncbi:hypothetical protein GCM10009599_16160 [Luteococcus peritonei]